ncbi:peptide chain release factor N(5)-glutamine methyltransferase [Aestuariivirga sp.]|uniref:peptide chain release factor N(5)-glutamine methyltransferase n=1 Tax=Aestuariivirga sp. TaxID=2650926 RepID=UPI0035940CE1
MPPDRVKPLLDWAALNLTLAGCETPVLDARLLLQAASGLTREDIILEPERELDRDAAERFRHMIERREAREPVSRILGEREFYGRVFEVTPDVLDPRPDTETLVDAALKQMPANARILDLGTGTGSIILTLLAERSDAAGTAADISPAALGVARMNAARLKLENRVTFRQASWFEGVAGQFDLIVSNPPYIPAAHIAGLAPDVRNFDPHLALVGGTDGLNPYRAIAEGARDHLAAGGHVLVEIGVGQADDVTAIFRNQGFQLAQSHQDLGGHIRCLDFVQARKP